MSGKLNGKTAVITGASRGLGKAMALALAAEGARIALVARDRERLDAVAAEIGAANGQATVVPADVTSEDQVRRMEREIAARFGKVDILINNAGVIVRKPMVEFTLEEWRRGESLLMDTGSPGGRDADRIMGVIQAAGVKQIDHMVSTHYHSDHVGGLQEVASRIPMAQFIDHGPSSEPKEQVPGFQKMYAELYAKAKHTVVKPGDKIPFDGVTVVVATSNGEVLKTPLPGGGKPNPACAGFAPRDESRVDPDNTMSMGLVFTYGKFRTVNLGDFTWNKEQDLMCPNNPIGTVDLYLTSHHGIDQSGSPALVHGLQPRVAIMHNSTRKGGAIQTMQTLHTSPGLEDIWQLHWAYAAGLEHNTPALFIANMEDNATVANVLLNPPPTFGQGRGPGAGGPPPPGAAAGAPNAPGPGGRAGGGPGGGRGGHTGPAFWIKVSAESDGTFSVTNTRNNFTKTYAARK